MPQWTFGVLMCKTDRESWLEVSAKHCICWGRSYGVRGCATPLTLLPGWEQWGVPLSSSKKRKTAVRLTGFPIFPKTRVFVAQLWSGSGKPAGPPSGLLEGKRWLYALPPISWMAGTFGKLALSSWKSLPLSRVCAYMLLSQRKNPPNSGQPNRFPYIGKHASHSWWKKLTRNPSNLVNSPRARVAQSQPA